ncbi:MAG TPA: ATP-binding protein, partial [Holophaga sp.]|nr:ATP-binding protein [Holophaga sp.]
MQDRNLFGVVVRLSDPANPNRFVTFGRVRDPGWRVLPTELDIRPEGLPAEERTVMAMGEPIGTLKLYLSTRFLEAELRRRLVEATVQTLGFDLLLIVSLYILLRKIVLKPLQDIERYATAVRLKGGAPAGFEPGRSYGELESLRVAIGEMVHLLQARLRSLQEKETTLTAVIDSVPQNVYWKNAEGKFLGCNKVFAHTAGLGDPGDILGRQDLDLPFHREESSATLAEDAQVLLSGTSRIHAIESFVSAEGRTVWLDVTKVPMLDGDGHPFAVLAVFEDITERKLAEEDRAKLQEQLNQTQKLESIGRLAGGVAHDNNNMLTAILMHAELLREQLGEDSQALRHIQAMEGAAERSTRLIRQLLAFSRKQVIEPKVLDLNELLAEFQKSMAPLVGEDIAFVFKPAGDLWKLKLDPAQVDQIVMNLVVNARDAMPRGGTLAIETTNVQIDADYCLENPWALPGDYVLLAVSDTGVGMPPEIQKKIFEPFFTTKEMGKGTGLGLSTVFGIIRQNEGFVNVYSEPGLGATFKVYLPRYTEVEARPEPQERVLEAVQPGRGQILVVEDDEILREVIPKILDRLGYTFIMADSPTEAIQICLRPDTQIDVVLTDVVMPGMSGKELWERIRPIRPEARVVYMSGYPADVISRQGVLEGGAHFIQKPFSTADIGKKLRSVLGIEVA